jgi:hypothetical protein
MGITEDRFVAEYAGHSIELVRNAWVKMLTLWIDGVQVAAESCALPHKITLNGTLEHQGVQHTVTATSVPDRIIFTKDSIEVDGVPLSVTRTK